MLVKTTSAKFFVAAALAIMLAGCSSGPNMKEGEWELKTSMKMGGMAMPALVTKQCLTKKDIVPQDNKESDQCTLTEKKVKGDTVSWTMVCNPEGGGGKSESHGEITYNDTTMSGTVTMAVSGGPIKMDMTSEISGRWLGKCP
ncbi:MAG: DUF3617 domain-containing protein [Thermodesulfobacteriota bacterium]